MDEDRKDLSERDAKELIEKAPGQHKTDLGGGDVLFDVVDSMERFALERIIIVAKEANVDEELLVAMLQANQRIAGQSRGRVASSNRSGKRRHHSKPEKDLTEQSLADSGLL